MANSKFNPTIIEEGLGAVAIVISILTSPILRPWYRKWGATENEVEKRLPGDEQVSHPNLENTRAITIQAPIDLVWPWLVQMGQGRGGLYSYERLENLVGCGMYNADRIIPEQQHLQVGDKVCLSQDDGTPYFVVTAIEPGRAIILGGDDPPTTWGFILDSIGEDSTRLIIRFRQEYEPTPGNVLSWRVFTDPINFVMERKMLQGIKVRAEAALAGASPNRLSSFHCEMLLLNERPRCSFGTIRINPSCRRPASMLIDRHETDNIFKRIPGLTIKMNPELAAIDRGLDDDKLFCLIRDDLAQRYPKTLTAGRKSTPVEVILRMLAVKHLYAFSYEETESHVADSLVLRQFCRVYFQAVPDHTTLCKWAQLIQPETLKAFNDRILVLAIEKKLTRGRKLRTDGTVVETTIHYPTDNSLLADSVRVLGRTLTRAKKILMANTELTKETFRNRTRSAKRAARQIAQLSRRGREQMKPHYQRLMRATQATIRQAEQVLTELQATSVAQGHQLIETLQTFMPRAVQVLEQTRRRVFGGESVPAAEKLVSIFEPHTDIIRRGKPNKDTEFGHKVWLGEVEGGFVSQYRVLDGNPVDDAQWQPTLQRHEQQFGHPPWQASADRGVYSADNESFATKLGVERVILPQPGRKSETRRQHERQRWFRRGRRFHAGVEGRISVIKRKYGLGRCRDHGLGGFERWVGWCIVANNLTMMGRGLSP